jgi:putative transcriptional regulator
VKGGFRMVYLKIQELLDKKGKTKYWLTNKMGKSHQSISNLMKKDLSGIHFDTIEQLCNIFDCEIGELIEVKSEHRKENKKIEQTNKKIK